MVFHRQLAVGFFDFIVASAAGNTKGFVIILGTHNFDSVLNKFELGSDMWAEGKKLKSIFLRPSENFVSDGLPRLVKA